MDNASRYALYMQFATFRWNLGRFLARHHSIISRHAYERTNGLPLSGEQKASTRRQEGCGREEEMPLNLFLDGLVIGN